LISKPACGQIIHPRNFAAVILPLFYMGALKLNRHALRVRKLKRAEARAPERGIYAASVRYRSGYVGEFMCGHIERLRW
jgi:hypothetical protein